MNPLYDRFAHSRQWYDSPPGRLQLDAEALFFSQHLARINGFVALLVAPCPGFARRVETGRFHCLVPLEQYQPTRLRGAFEAWVDCLPLCSERCDVVMLAHLLDWQTEPLPVLQEWVRVLKPGGRLLLTMHRGAIGGWNPWPGPATPQGYLPGLTRRRLQSLGLELISRQWLLPLGSGRSPRWPWLAPMRAPVVGLHLRKTRRQLLIQPLTQPAGAVLPSP